MIPYMHARPAHHVDYVSPLFMNPVDDELYIIRAIMHRGHHSFDMRGLRFAAKFLVVILILFPAVRYGTAIAADAIISTNEKDLVTTESRLEQMILMR